MTTATRLRSTAGPLVDRLGRSVAHVLLGTRRWADRLVVDAVGSGADVRILEIGSGRQDLGVDAYSLRPAFPDAGEFVQSDVNPEFGHRVIDVTNLEFTQEYDVILCMNVLEHVYDFATAIRNLHAALRPGGRLFVAVPHLYPLHDEPIDFWRFTEHSLRRMFADFSTVDVRHNGMRRFPRALMVIATK